MSRWVLLLLAAWLLLLLAGCAAPRNLPAPAPPPVDTAAIDSPLTETSGGYEGTPSDAHIPPAPAGEGPEAGIIPPDAAPDAPPPPPDAAPDLAVDKAPKPDRPVVMEPPPPPPPKTCIDCGNDCWPPAICVVANGADQLGRVPLGPFCVVAKGGTNPTGTATWEIAGPDGTCTDFFRRFHDTACMHGHPGLIYQERMRRYDLRGEYLSETGDTVTLSCP